MPAGRNPTSRRAACCCMAAAAGHGHDGLAIWGSVGDAKGEDRDEAEVAAYFESNWGPLVAAHCCESTRINLPTDHLKTDDGSMLPALPALALPLATPPPSATPPCSLNGMVVGGKCQCDKPWKGSACEFMDLLPVTYPQGYGMPHVGLKNITTWGGNVLYDNASGTHHLYVSRMSNDCNLVDYQKNSRIDHAVSLTGPTGPYTFHDVAIPTFSHNAAPITLPDGTYAIFHVGAGTGPPNGGVNCSNRTAVGHRLPSALDTPFQDLARTGRTSYGVHVSKSLDGPWGAVPGVKACNNPAPWVHPNGTLYLWCGGSLLRADSIAGPYTKVGNQTLSGTGVAGHLE